MFVTGFPAAAFGTNCYLVAPAEGEECVVVDPGIGIEETLAETLRRHRLRPAAVLLTHGHLDHVYSVTPVCGAHGVAAVVHKDDRYRLQDPVSMLGPELRQLFTQQFAGETWHEPDDVIEIGDGAQLEYAGLRIDVLHAPGHTEGSIMFRLPEAPEVQGPESLSSTLLAGDVLFRGGIGRTDLQGGSDAEMTASLRDKVLTLDDDTLVLPGHGPLTTIGQERATNPFLLQVTRSG